MQERNGPSGPRGLCTARAAATGPWTHDSHDTRNSGSRNGHRAADAHAHHHTTEHDERDRTSSNASHTASMMNAMAHAVLMGHLDPKQALAAGTLLRSADDIKHRQSCTDFARTKQHSAPRTREADSHDPCVSDVDSGQPQPGKHRLVSAKDIDAILDDMLESKSRCLSVLEPYLDDVQRARAADHIRRWLEEEAPGAADADDRTRGGRSDPP